MNDFGLKIEEIPIVEILSEEDQALLGSTLADRVDLNEDAFDPNTVHGCVNRLIKLTRANKSLGERYSFFPIVDPIMYKQYKLQEVAVWSSNEMDFSRDKKDYEALPPCHRRLIDYINAFFSATDGSIIDSIVLRLLLEASTTEEQSWYMAQGYIEMVHSETYSLIINTLISDPKKRNALFMAANSLPSVRKKNLWLHRYTMSGLPRAYRLLANAAGEGIFFHSSFLFIFFFRAQGVLQNIIFANEQISKDEGLHCQTGVILYKKSGLLPDSEAIQLIEEAVDLECEFIDTIFNPSEEESASYEVSRDQLVPTGIHVKDVKNYVRFLADHLLVSCGHPRRFNIRADSLPTWINDIAMEQKGNFYEVRIGNYNQSSIAQALDWEARIAGSHDKMTAAYSNPSDVPV